MRGSITVLNLEYRNGILKGRLSITVGKATTGISRAICYKSLVSSIVEVGRQADIKARKQDQNGQMAPGRSCMNNLVEKKELINHYNMLYNMHEKFEQNRTEKMNGPR